MGFLLWSCWPCGLIYLQTSQTIASEIGYAPELDGKTLPRAEDTTYLSHKTQRIQVCVVIWTLHLYWFMFIILEGDIHSTRRAK